TVPLPRTGCVAIGQAVGVALELVAGAPARAGGASGATGRRAVARSEVQADAVALPAVLADGADVRALAGELPVGGKGEVDAGDVLVGAHGDELRRVGGGVEAPALSVLEEVTVAVLIDCGDDHVLTGKDFTPVAIVEGVGHQASGLGL